MISKIEKTTSERHDEHLLIESDCSAGCSYGQPYNNPQCGLGNLCDRLFIV